MQPPLPSPTATWHNASYPAIDPLQKELSVSGKTVVITGAGSGIGRATALAFAAAKAANIHLIGQDKHKLEETSGSIAGRSKVFIHSLNVTDLQAFSATAKAIGAWDILILCAGYQPTPTAFAGSDSQDWWQAFEVNVRGVYNSIHELLPTANKNKASIFALTTGGVTMPTSTLPGMSAYISSKIALAKLIEFVAAENANVNAVAVHPGIVDTDNFKKGGIPAEMMPMDAVDLPAHFLVWLASDQAAFLKGRTVWANWDVAELMQKKDQIVASGLSTSGYLGFPFTSSTW